MLIFLIYSDQLKNYQQFQLKSKYYELLFVSLISLIKSLAYMIKLLHLSKDPRTF